ncbi:LytR/AlgR family response regulator transcription factor [Candidatus Stoquefichus massiliensis]|uniref:LytR/AlgR family response regulator transcription factor n=1 Tax=Candidatus Stoquefichus massiliensis TaxID=1470350 RepID=UPI000487500A|nr:LytTR family DNA-binding domain-containing protein [Candidatus Stoquefichus massiliensis]
MKINLVLETQYKEQILKTIQNKLCYQEVLPTPNNRPYIVIKDVLSIKDIESIKENQYAHHRTIFVVKDSENMFLLLDFYPLCFLRENHLNDDLQKAMELIINIYQGIESILTFKMGYSYIQIKASQIVYIESIGHYLIIHTIHNQYQVREKLKNVLEQLTELSFQQIHKSYVINKKYVKEIGATEVILFKNISLPIGRKFKNIT